jgi:hypothetical protein
MRTLSAGVTSSKRDIVFALLAVPLLLLAAADGAGSGRGFSSLGGIWSVVSVKVNMRGVSAWTRDDPRLVNLALIVGPSRLEFGAEVCADPRLTEQTRDVDSLIQETYGSSAADMELVTPNVVTPVFFVSCRVGALGPVTPPGSWILRINEDTIAVRWYDGALLVLRRPPHSGGCYGRGVDAELCADAV